MSVYLNTVKQNNYLLVHVNKSKSELNIYMIIEACTPLGQPKPGQRKGCTSLLVVVVRLLAVQKGAGIGEKKGGEMS